MDQQNFPDPGALQRLVAEAEAEATSENSAVRVLAGPGGQIKELDLRPNAFQMSGVELGEMIVETLRAAHTKVERELAVTISRETGMEMTPGDLGGGVPGVDPIEREQ
ncbi:YbaB/EbfC family nucleoid-associated protein [Glycomyces arizonensis]|uniref:YbaB/EbfC family nucleoid-associated protein n=1 Tax=Glycomyces arizonensis TaxID=256035 RepID=UPI0004223344|nr:YbaB/EbfC family nucleoid-associated protein [Glycomyces arizonensis]